LNGSKPFDVHLDGRRYGSWWELDGKDVVVSGAYGSRRAPIGRRKAETVAAELLTAILKERKL
jgi:hypothetical protein